MIDTALLNQALKRVKDAFPGKAPSIGLVLGSGWSGVSELYGQTAELSYSAVPGLGAASVPGHAGAMFVGEFAGIRTLVFKGRRHWYEGQGWTPVALPIYLLHQLGAKALVLTSSVGAISPVFSIGDIVLTADHLNVSGVNPLVSNDHTWPPQRFPDFTRIYDPDLRALAKEAGSAAGMELKEAVLAVLSGPNYETPSEVRMLERLGAQLVGMSLVFEAMLAAACGLRVLGCACVTNWAAGLDQRPRTHDEVLQTMRGSERRISAFFGEFWQRLSVREASLDCSRNPG